MKPKELNHLKQTLLSLKSSDFESFLKIQNDVFFESDQLKETEINATNEDVLIKLTQSELKFKGWNSPKTL